MDASQVKANANRPVQFNGFIGEGSHSVGPKEFF